MKVDNPSFKQVQSILQKRAYWGLKRYIDSQKRVEYEFLVKYRGHSYLNAEWIAEQQIAPQLVKDFEQRTSSQDQPHSEDSDSVEDSLIKQEKCSKVQSPKQKRWQGFNKRQEGNDTRASIGKTTKKIQVPVSEEIAPDRQYDLNDQNFKIQICVSQPKVMRHHFYGDKVKQILQETHFFERASTKSSDKSTKIEIRMSMRHLKSILCKNNSAEFRPIQTLSEEQSSIVAKIMDTWHRKSELSKSGVDVQSGIAGYRSSRLDILVRWELASQATTMNLDYLKAYERPKLLQYSKQRQSLKKRCEDVRRHRERTKVSLQFGRALQRESQKNRVIQID